jgi:hypothetical protein
MDITLDGHDTSLPYPTHDVPPDSFRMFFLSIRDIFYSLINFFGAPRNSIANVWFFTIICPGTLVRVFHA